nr:tail tip fiber protein [uncultured Mediterranean phage uvMED]BAR25748.1 tail tip fiber protein [uncultured Mediterranean phage uvMED]
MAEDLLKGGKRRKGTVGSFPVPQDFSAEGKRFAQSVNDSLQQLRGEKGNRLDSACTFSDLIELGIAEKNPIQTTGGANTLTSNNSRVTNVLKSVSEEGVDFPTAPTGASASGAFKNIILDWDYPNYRGHSHTEIFVFDTDQYNLLEIEKGRLSPNFLGQTTATVFNHSVGNGVTKRYWIRHVNKNNIVGPVHATNLAGLSASTVLIDTNSVENLAIENSKIGNLAVDEAKIANLAVTGAKIANASIDTAKISSLEGTVINTNTLNANRITTNTLDVRNKASSGTSGHVLATSANRTNTTGYNYGTSTNTSIWYQTFGAASPYHSDSSGTFNSGSTPSLLQVGAQQSFRPEFSGTYVLSFNFESFGALGAHRTFASVISYTQNSSFYDTSITSSNQNGSEFVASVNSNSNHYRSNSYFLTANVYYVFNSFAFLHDYFAFQGSNPSVRFFINGINFRKA